MAISNTLSNLRVYLVEASSVCVYKYINLVVYLLNFLRTPWVLLFLNSVFVFIFHIDLFRTYIPSCLVTILHIIGNCCLFRISLRFLRMHGALSSPLACIVVISFRLSCGVIDWLCNVFDVLSLFYGGISFGIVFEGRNFPVKWLFLFVFLAE